MKTCRLWEIQYPYHISRYLAVLNLDMSPLFEPDEEQELSSLNSVKESTSSSSNVNSTTTTGSSKVYFYGKGSKMIAQVLSSLSNCKEKENPKALKLLKWKKNYIYSLSLNIEISLFHSSTLNILGIFIYLDILWVATVR